MDDTTRVYFDLCAVSLDSDRIADIRARNGFKSGCDLVIKVPEIASRSTMLCNRPVKSIKRLNPVELDQEKCLAAKAGKAAKAAAKADKPTKASQPSEKNVQRRRKKRRKKLAENLQRTSKTLTRNAKNLQRTSNKVMQRTSPERNLKRRIPFFDATATAINLQL